MTDILSTKEIAQPATLGSPKGIKNAVSVSTVSDVESLIRNENITSEGHK